MSSWARRFVPLGTVVAMVTGLAASSCSGDHDRLAKGGGGTTASPGGAGGSAGQDVGGAGGGAGGNGGGVVEPTGETKATVVNGVVDADAVRVCLVPYPDGSSAPPWPEDDVLAFGRGLPVAPFEDWWPAGEDLELRVLTGELDATLGMTCDELSPSETLTISSAGVLPASVRDSGRSLLLALYGCVGGAEHVANSQEMACGEGYEPSLPTLGLAAGGMSRIVVEGRIGIQLLQASAGTPPTSSVRARAGLEAATSLYVANDWSLGAIVPYPPFAVYSLAGLGTSTEAQIETYLQGSDQPANVTTFAQAFEGSSLSLADLAEGINYVFIARGASAQLGPGEWWHDYGLTVVLADP